MKQTMLQPLVTAAITATTIAGLVGGCTMDDGSPTRELASGSLLPGGRPHSVPAEYVPTPSGWFHPSLGLGLPGL